MQAAMDEVPLPTDCSIGQEAKDGLMAFFRHTAHFLAAGQRQREGKNVLGSGGAKRRKASAKAAAPAVAAASDAAGAAASASAAPSSSAAPSTESLAQRKAGDIQGVLRETSVQ